MAVSKNILVATDFSEYSNKALSEAVKLAGQENANIHLLHVIDHVHNQKKEGMDIGKEDIIVELEKRYLRESQEMMDKQLDSLESAMRSQIMATIKTGPPADIILKEQKRKEADLIVIGSHGVKGFFSGLVGGVTYKVVKNAPCSVMVVRQ